MRYFIVFSLVVLFPLLAHSQQLKAIVSSKEVILGQSFELGYELDGLERGQLSAPPFDPSFQVLTPTPIISQNLSVINGQATRTTRYIYKMVARKAGEFQFPPATFLSASGKKWVSEAVSVKVVPAGQSTQSPSAPQVRIETTPPDGSLDDDIFLRAELNKAAVYVGEPIYVTYKLYKRVRTSHNIRLSMPTFEGFWMEDLPVSDTGRLTNLGGKRYESYEIRKVLLFPQQSGTLTIPELGMETEVYLTGNPFDVKMPSLDDILSGNLPDINFGFQPYITKSAPITIEVKPLPTAGKPADFAGLVGRFALSTEAPTQDLTQEEAIKFTATLSGDGNLKMMNAPVLQLPKGWESFEPEKEEHIAPSVEGFSGSISYEYAIQADTFGDFKFTPVHISFFNPDKEKYETLTSPELRYHVKPHGKARTTTLADKGVESGGKPWVFPSLYSLIWGGLCIGLLLLGSWVVYKKSQSYPAKREEVVVSPTSYTIDNVRAFVSDSQKNPSQHPLEERLHALRKYLQSEFGLPISVQTQENIQSALAKRGVGEDNIRLLQHHVAQCQSLLYASSLTVSPPSIKEFLGILSNIDAEKKPYLPTEIVEDEWVLS